MPFSPSFSTKALSSREAWLVKMTIGPDRVISKYAFIAKTLPSSCCATPRGRKAEPSSSLLPPRALAGESNSTTHEFGTDWTGSLSDRLFRPQISCGRLAHFTGRIECNRYATHKPYGWDAPQVKIKVTRPATASRIAGKYNIQCVLP